MARRIETTKMALAKLKNKQKMCLRNSVVSKNQEEVRPSCSNNQKHRRDSDESISSIDSVLKTIRHGKVHVFDEARTLSKTDDHFNKSKSLNNKQALTLSNVHDDSDKSDNQSKKKALFLSNTNNHSKNSGSPSKKKAVASSNTTDESNESYESSDKENQTNDNTSQPNERIPPPVAAPEAQEDEDDEEDDDLVPIGSGRTLIRSDRYRAVYWKSYNYATRTLLRGVFSREVLSTHSLNGIRSLAFPDRPARMCLDEQKVRDIIMEVKKRFKVNEKIIRKIIDRKCSDERNMRKTGPMEQ